MERAEIVCQSLQADLVGMLDPKSRFFLLSQSGW